jgi:hypothetical protein
VHDRPGNGATDDAVFAHARAEGRAIVTENIRDYRPLARATHDAGEAYSGLILTTAKRWPRHDPGSSQTGLRHTQDASDSRSPTARLRLRVDHDGGAGVGHRRLGDRPGSRGRDSPLASSGSRQFVCAGLRAGETYGAFAPILVPTKGATMHPHDFDDQASF